MPFKTFRMNWRFIFFTQSSFLAEKEGFGLKEKLKICQSEREKGHIMRETVNYHGMTLSHKVSRFLLAQMKLE